MKQAELQESNPEVLATAVLRHQQGTEAERRKSIEQLTSLATSPHRETAKAATRAIFASLIEPLADSFEAPAVTLYNRIFAQMAQLCRRLPVAGALDEELTRFGLPSEGDLVSRAEQLRYVRRLPHNPAAKRAVKRVVVLSRVTIGADAAITSLVLERVKREFPAADIALVGNAKAAEIFGGDRQFQFGEIHYQRAGTLTERLLNWLDVVASVRSYGAGLSDEEMVIVDPDSRLTQLGLLPLSHRSVFYPAAGAPAAKAQGNEAYLFFPSRELGGTSSHSLSELTSIWLNAVFGGEEKMMPRLALKDQDTEQASTIIQRLRNQDSRPLVSINFGVGENMNKRVSDTFETQLISRLLQEGVRVILDKGTGEEERQRADAAIAEAQQARSEGRRLKVLAIDEASLHTLLQKEVIEADILVWSGRLGLLAALISKSDLYIGYDSAGQHIAAALGIPCLDIFAGYSAPRMLDRWRPTGKAEVRIVAVDTLRGTVNDVAILEAALAHAHTMMGGQ